MVLFQYYLSRAYEAVKMFFRMIKTILYRQFAVIRAHFRQIMNFSRRAGKAATATVQTATGTSGKPSKREDYFRLAHILVSKALVARVILGLILAAALVIYVIWPFVLSHFLTAKFYEQDKRVAGWTGQVIVFSDKNKEIRRYAGKLEDGVLQGKGEAYDDNGVLEYRGMFEDGKRTGNGICWKDSVLLYEGGLTDGKYDGRGRLYDDKGIVYSGEFEDGSYQGSGTLYENGVRRYEGSFLKNLPDGSGRSYDEKGRLIYEGSFVSGEYNGTGVWYPGENERVEAEFKNGKPIGTVTWRKDGRLYYEGEWGDGCPSGYGTLYDRAGRQVYTGAFSFGTIDGFSLLGLTADDLREQLGQRNTESRMDGEGGFLLTDSELGLVIRCTLQTETESSKAYSVRLTQSERWNGWLTLLPNDSHVSIDHWKKDAVVHETRVQTGEGGIIPAGQYHCVSMTQGENTITAYYPAGETGAIMLEWTSGGQVPALDAQSAASGGAPGAAEGASGAESGVGSEINAAAGSAMQALVTAIDGMKGAGAVRLNTEENPYYGKTDPKIAITACATPEDAGRLIDAMTDYWLQAQTQAALEKSLERVEQSLEEAKRDASLGTQHKDTGELGRQQITLKKQIDECISARKEAQLKVADLCDPAKYDLSLVPMLFDPSFLRLEDLSLIAAAYAQMKTGENDDGVEGEVKLALLSLQKSWSSVNTAKELYSLSLSVARGVAGSFSLGTATKDDWYAALGACSDADIAFKSAVADFEKQANALNQMLAGSLTRSCGWHTEELTPVYATLAVELDRAIQEAKEAAELAAREAEEAEKNAAEDAEEKDGAADGSEDKDSDGESGAGDGETPPDAQPSGSDG